MGNSKEKIELFNIVYSSLMENPEKWKRESWDSRPYTINDELSITVGDRNDARREKADRHLDIAVHILKEETHETLSSSLYDIDFFPWKDKMGNKLLDAINTLEERQGNRIIKDRVLSLRSPMSLAREALEKRAGK